MKQKKIKGGELALYIISGLIAVGGLTLAVLHTVGMNLSYIDNPLRNANNSFAETMKMSFLVFGTLLIVLGAIIATITLAVNGAKAELIEEKRIRRQQRLALEEAGEVELE